LRHLRNLTAIAQEGITYARNPFDHDRYTRLKRLTAQIGQDLDGAGPDGPSPLRLAVEAEQGYLTPKLDVRAAVFDDDDAILLVREARDGAWTPPGGWVDSGQTIGRSAVREVFEESGYTVQVDRLLGIYDREAWGHPPMTWHTLKAVVACRLIGGQARTSPETDAVAWFDRDDIPPLSTSRCSLELLRRIFAHHDDPNLPPDIS
jgi:ADP-ribose pyrophosphatase YjhB (NUDIX family)